MKKRNLGVASSNWQWVGIALICFGSGIVAGDEIQQIRPADSLPESTPWDLEALSRAPEFSWDAGDDIRSLHYVGETYQGKKTRVFAYYSNPDTLLGKTSKDKHFPAIVLVHGGGGTAFPHWVKLWAKRGYAAIAMDLAGCGPDRERLPDGGPGQGAGSRQGFQAA